MSREVPNTDFRYEKNKDDYISFVFATSQLLVSLEPLLEPMALTNFNGFCCKR